MLKFVYFEHFQNVFTERSLGHDILIELWTWAVSEFKFVFEVSLVRISIGMRLQAIMALKILKILNISIFLGCQVIRSWLNCLNFQNWLLKAPFFSFKSKKFNFKLQIEHFKSEIWKYKSRFENFNLKIPNLIFWRLYLKSFSREFKF